MALKKVGQHSEIIVEEKIFGLANIIQNQYVIYWAQIPKLIAVNQVIVLTIETWHTYIGHLKYMSLLKLPKLVRGIKAKRPASTEICSRCIKSCLE